MSKKIVLKGRIVEPESFQNLFWFIHCTPKDILHICAQNELTCMCYLATTPVTSSVYFHLKEKIYA